MVATGQRRPILGLAMATLAGMCDYANTLDGRGFNAADAGLGHRLAEKAEYQWSIRERRAAYRLAIKYRGQLSSAGIDVDAIPSVPADAPADALIARVPAACAACGGKIEAGGLFIWGRERGQREHADAASCAPQPSLGDQSKTQQSACRSCGERVRFGDLCGDCAMADFPEQPASAAPARRVRPSWQRWLLAGNAGTPPAPARRTGLTARALLGNDGPIAAALPGYREREPQLQLADTIAAAIADGEHAAAEAGTGTGKSLGYLVPGLASGHQCIVSTADKSLQAQIVGKDVPFLQGHLPFAFTAALLKGRGNYVCRARIAEIERQAGGTLGADFGFRSAEAAAAWPTLRAWVEETETGDLETVPFRLPGDLVQDVIVSSEECTGRKCPLYTSCFAEQAKARAQDADVVVVNHALLLRDADVRAATGDAASILPNATVLLLDEAHHLADVARDAFAIEVTAGRWQRIARRIERLTVKHPGAQGESDEQIARRERAELWTARAALIGDELVTALDGIAARLVDAKASALRLGDESALQRASASVAAFAADMANGAPSWLAGEDEPEAWRRLTGAADRLANDLGALADDAAGVEWVRYAELEGRGDRQRVKLLSKPVDVADLLRERIFERFDTVAACSATISTTNRGRPSFDLWKRETGCDRPRELVVPSPFDYARQAALYTPADGAAFDPRNHRGDGEAAYQDRIAAEVERLVRASRGGAFVLFTSYRMLQAVHDRLSTKLADLLVLRQGEAMRPALVQQFRSDGNAVLFGTKSFWEGVDVQGDALRLVVIVGLPFAPPDDPMWSARCDAIERRGGKWFFDLALPTSIIALKQAFGRLIRSVDDRGVVAMLDGRLTTARYGRDILDSLPPARRTQLPDAAEAFFTR